MKGDPRDRPIFRMCANCDAYLIEVYEVRWCVDCWRMILKVVTLLTVIGQLLYWWVK